MEPKVFYAVRKPTRVAIIAESEAIKDSRNVVNVVVLLPNASDSGNQESNTKEVSTSMEKIYEPAGELEIEDLKSNDTELPLPTPTKMTKTASMKKDSDFETVYQRKEFNFTENLSDLEGNLPYKVRKNLFSEDRVEHIVLQTNLYSNQDQNNQHFTKSNKEMELFLGVVLLTGYHSLPQEHHYWSMQPDLGVSAVYNTVSRNR